MTTDNYLQLNTFSAVARFCEKSLSLATKRTYRRVTSEFLAFVGNRPVNEVGPATVIAWRDQLMRETDSADTVRLKLSVVRSLYDYLKAAGLVAHNPADTKLVAVPALSDELAGRALTNLEVASVLAVPDTTDAIGARDYAMMLMMFRTFMRAHEISGLQVSSFARDGGRTVARVKVKGGRTRTIPIPGEVVTAVGNYLALDAERRKACGSDGLTSHVFQPHSNRRTGEMDKAISERMIWNIVNEHAHRAGIGHVSPHDFRRTAATRALEQGMTYKQVQLGGGWKNAQTIQRYDHSRNNLDQNAINYLDYGMSTTTNTWQRSN